MSDSIKMVDVENYLMHYGVKGMRWGVRRNSDGSGTIKAKFRPTYTGAERREAQKITKQAKASGGKALDKDGFDVTRLAQQRTKARRAVNFLLGGRVYWATVVAANAAVVATAGAPVAVAAGVGAVAGSAYMAANLHNNYKVFFKNMVKNPKVKLKAGVTAEDMTRIATGKAFTKIIMQEQGKIKISAVDGKTKATAFDKEGRELGTVENVPLKIK